MVASNYNLLDEKVEIPTLNPTHKFNLGGRPRKNQTDPIENAESRLNETLEPDAPHPMPAYAAF